KPRSPVQQLAQPLLATMARAEPPLACSAHTKTGAALTALRVKTAAAAAGLSLSETSNNTSSPCSLMPPRAAPAAKSWGDVTPPPGTGWNGPEYSDGIIQPFIISGLATYNR